MKFLIKKNELLKYIYKWRLLISFLIILAIITYYRVGIQIYLGPPYDTYDFLANAADMAGKNIGYYDLRPPFISFLTSIVFRFEGLSTTPIFYIDGFLYMIGAIGLFLFLKIRFNDLTSFLGALLYSTFPIVLTYVGVGYPDLPSVSLSIWALYLTVLAVKKDSRFFFISFPIAMISFLTRYNQALVIFPIFLYIIINIKKLNNLKNLVIGILLSIVVIVPFLAYFFLKFGNPILPFIDFYGTSAGSVSILHFDYNPDLLFYIKYLPFMIGYGAWIIVLILFGGLLLGWIKLIKGSISFQIKMELVKNQKKNILIILILTMIFWITLGNITYIFSEIIFFSLCLISFNLLKKNSSLEFDFLFLSWFGTFLIFNSVFLVKDIRYFLALMPTFSYILIRGLNLFENHIGSIKNKKFTFYLAPILIIVILVSTTFYLISLPAANEYNQIINKDMSTASIWLIGYDPEYKSKVIYSDLWPYSGWFLQTAVKKMPQFKENKTYYNSLKNYYPTIQDNVNANNFLVQNNAYYYFSIRKWQNLTNFKAIQQFGHVIIYQRIK